MFGDAHNTNWAENYQFFLNQNNPTNFERVWRQVVLPLPPDRHHREPAGAFDQVMDFSVIAEAGQGGEVRLAEGRVPDRSSAPRRCGQIKAESEEILTNTVVIHFFPNSWDLHKTVTREIDGKDGRGALRSDGRLVLEEIAKLTGSSARPGWSSRATPTAR